MPKLRFHISMSLDGYVAGPNQGRDAPLGEGAEEVLHDWFTRTRSFKSMLGKEDEGETGLDNDRAEAWRQNFGATIMGRNMFGPIRGEWGDEEWKGWWGDEPPYHSPVFVLTHHAHEPIEMDGGTTFHFVTEGPEAALKRAREVAESRDINIGGGASTAQQYLRHLVDQAEPLAGTQESRDDVDLGCSKTSTARRRTSSRSRSSVRPAPPTSASCGTHRGDPERGMMFSLEVTR
jgi:dihydrofolate reductase